MGVNDLKDSLAGVGLGWMRFVVCLIVSTMVLVGCTDAEERFLNEQFDLNRISQPHDGAILLALVRADGSVAAVDTGEAPWGLVTRSALPASRRHSRPLWF